MPLRTSARKKTYASAESSILEKMNAIKAIMLQVDIDLTKFESRKNKSAGTRVRRAMQDIKGLAQDIRMQILDSSK